jgi:glycosyltransferase involved in cell wall biosynthesis
LETQLLRQADLAVYDFDDALQWDEGTDGILRRLVPKAPKALAAVRTADRVIAGNAVLGEWAAEHNRDVRVIPSCVSPSDYRERAGYEVNDPPRLGWVGSLDNECHLSLVGTALEEVNRRCGARLVLFGTPSRRLGRLERLIDRVPWSEDRVRGSLAEVDMGLMPLPSDRYSTGKCGYKLLQYGAAAVPFVASPVGVNSDILALTRMPAPVTRDEWVDAILDLLARPATARELLGRHARLMVDRCFSYEAWQGRWKEAVGLGSSDRGEPGPTTRAQGFV